MKKLFSLLLLALPLTLGGCIKYNGIPQKKSGGDVNPPGPVDPDDPGEVEADITTYLVLSPVGLYQGDKGNIIPEKFIENAVTYVAKAGSALPDKTDITSTTFGVEFVSWLCYEGSGAPTEYTSVPQVSGKILYASFETTGEAPETEGDTEDSYVFTLNTKLENGEGNWQDDNAVIFAYLWEGANDSYNDTIQLTKASDSYFTFEVDKEDAFDHVLFVRMPAGSSELNFDSKWNQTVDLELDLSFREVQITAWDAGDGKCGARWIR